MSGDLEQIKADIAVTKAELVIAKANLAQAEESKDEAKIVEYKDDVKRKENLLIEQQREKNLLLAGAGSLPTQLKTPPPLGKRDTGKQQSLTKKLIKRCNSKDDARRCEICDVPSAVLETVHLFDLAGEKEYLTFFEADREHMPISINHPENGLLICRNCHGYFDKKPQRLLHIKSNGTIELTGLAKTQNYAGLHGKKVPWVDKINKKDWPTSALLNVVYKLPPKSRKRKGTDLDEGIVDATDLPASPPEQDKVTKKSKATTPRKGRATAKKRGL